MGKSRKVIYITHVLWHKNAIGIASRHLRGDCEYVVAITVVDRFGGFIFPDTLKVKKKELSSRYPEEVINKKGLRGYFIPIDDFKLFY